MKDFSENSAGYLSMVGGKKYYAVIRGFNPGIYNTWYGPDGAEVQVKGYENAMFKGFPSLEEAKRWIQEMSGDSYSLRQGKQTGVKAKNGPFSTRRDSLSAGALDTPTVSSPSRTFIYTDGGCRKNPGPGGYGVVILEGKTRREMSRGFGLTTNNRMELMACIEALKSLSLPSDVILHSDSQYVVKGIEKGWAKKWKRNGWKRTSGELALNADLWAELLDLCTLHRVRFVWVRGHAGNTENERCDTLATEAAATMQPAEDVGYLKQKGTAPIVPGAVDTGDRFV